MRSRSRPSLLPPGAFQCHLTVCFFLMMYLTLAIHAELYRRICKRARCTSSCHALQGKLYTSTASIKVPTSLPCHLDKGAFFVRQTPVSVIMTLAGFGRFRLVGIYIMVAVLTKGLSVVDENGVHSRSEPRAQLQTACLKRRCAKRLRLAGGF